jgi:hypothetical protein
MRTADEASLRAVWETELQEETNLETMAAYLAHYLGAMQQSDVWPVRRKLNDEILPAMMRAGAVAKHRGKNGSGPIYRLVATPAP